MGDVSPLAEGVRRVTSYHDRVRIVAALFLALPILAAVVAAPAKPAAQSCARWAAPFGEDTNVGTRAKPFATVGKLASSLAPGTTGCLEPNATFETHGLINAAGAAGAPIRITSGPGGRAVLNDGLEFAQTAKYVTLDNVTIASRKDTPSGELPATVILRGFSNKLVRTDISAGNVIDVARSCILVDHARRATIDRSAIHDCGKFVDGSGNLYYAGISVSIGVATTITNNTISGNAGDGIALTPNSQISTIKRNLIVDSGAGVYFSGGPKVASRDNLVANNIITHSERFAAHGSYQPNAPIGRSNVVTKNCIWATHVVAGQGFVAPANKRVNPRVVRTAAGYRVAPSSPCRAYAPAP